MIFKQSHVLKSKHNKLSYNAVMYETENIINVHTV